MTEKQKKTPTDRLTAGFDRGELLKTETREKRPRVTSAQDRQRLERIADADVLTAEERDELLRRARRLEAGGGAGAAMARMAAGFAASAAEARAALDDFENPGAVDQRKRAEAARERMAEREAQRRNTEDD